MPAQSVESASDSACSTSFSLCALTASRSDSSEAKYALRRLVNEFRAADSRFHSAASIVRSACGAAFHSSSSSAIRSPLCFQCVASAEIRSASSTIRSLTPRASLRACSRAALTSSRRWSTTPVSASSRVLSTVEVADRVGVGHRREQPLHGRLGLGGGDLGRLHPLLEQRDLGLKRRELAPEEHERLFRAARRPRADHPLAIGGAHVDRPVGVYPTPGIVGGGHGEPPGSPAAPAVKPGRNVAQLFLLVRSSRCSRCR